MYSAPVPITPQSLNFMNAAPLTPSDAPLTNLGTPQYPSGGGGLFGDMNGLDTAKLAIAGLQTLGNLWGAFQAQKLAKQQFSFTKDITETNLANQIKSYNTALSDRARSRGHMEGQSQAQVQDYINKNNLSR